MLSVLWEVAVALQVLHRTANGLIAGPNPLTAQEGSCLQAENCVVDRDGITEKRRGFNRHAAATSPGAMDEYSGRLMLHRGTTVASYDCATGATTAYSGSFSAPGSYRMRFLEVNKSDFFCTSKGVYKLDSISGTPTKAGMDPGLDMALSLSTGGWFTINTTVGYRVVFTRKDANDRLVEGAPSWQRRISNITGTSGYDGNPRGISLVITLPPGVAVGDSCEVYRTYLSADASSSPGMDHYLVKSVTVADISTKTITVSDAVIEDLLSTPLTTNADEDTENGEASRPPWCTDMAYYRGYVYYFNTKREQELELALQDVTGIVDLTDSVTLTFADTSSYTYQFAATESIANRRFQRFTALTDVENIRETMESFCRVVNRDTNNVQVLAFYASGEDDAPGKVKLRLRDLGESAFSITATAGCGAKFTPAIPTTGTTISSFDQAHSNGMCWAKFEEPEAVPLSNFKQVGKESVSGTAILRGLALQASLIVCKEEGVWRQIGETEDDFDLRPLDPELGILGADTCVILDNTVFAMSFQGLVRISENGTALISWPIEYEFKKIFSFSNFRTISHATSYKSERKYVIWTQSVAVDTVATTGWCYNHLTQKWTTWAKTCSCSCVASVDDKLYLGQPTDGYLLQERKSYQTSLSDYQDEEIPCTITGVSVVTDAEGVLRTQCVVTYTYGDLADGHRLYQAATFMASNVETAADLGGGSWELLLEEYLPTLVAGAATLSLPIVMTVRWTPEDCGNAGISKFFNRAQIYFEDDSAIKHDVHFWVDRHDSGFITDTNNDLSWYSAVLTPSQGWGFSAWGVKGWGDSDPSVAPNVLADIPTQFNRGVTIGIYYRNRAAIENPKILNLALTYRPCTDLTTAVPK